MPLITGINIGIQTPLEFITSIEAQRIAAQRDASARQQFGNSSEKISYNDTGYSTTRGILCEKGFEEQSDRIVLFQFNPEIVNDVKHNNYETRHHTGMVGNDFIWGSGGERMISFKLHFEASAGVNTSQFGKVRQTNQIGGQPTLTTRSKFFPRGTLDDVETVQAFQYPRQLDPKTPRFSNGGFIPSPKFMPPPIVIFAMGGYYLEGIIAEAPVEHQLFDRDLVPVRSEINVTFKVLEAMIIPVKNIVGLPAKFATNGAVINGSNQVADIL